MRRTRFAASAAGIPAAVIGLRQARARVTAVLHGGGQSADAGLDQRRTGYMFSLRSALTAGQSAGQFGTAAYAQLAIHAAEMELDRFRAEVKLAADLPVGEPVSRKQRDPQFGFG